MSDFQEIRRIHRVGYDHALITVLEDLGIREWARSISPGGDREEAEVTDIIRAVNRRLHPNAEWNIREARP